MGCNCSCHPKLEKIGVRGCCFKCEREHGPLRMALQAVADAKILVANAGAGVGAMLEGAQDAIQEDRDRVSRFALENGRIWSENARLRTELSRASDILAGREKANCQNLSFEWDKMLGRFG